MHDQHITVPIEKHPWQPFMPDDAEVLFLGTFPPPRSRWGMDFFYPNRTNDFWKVMGLIFAGSIDAFYDSESRSYKLSEIKTMLRDRHIALWDTAMEVRRLRGNASDKFLEIVKPIDLIGLIARIPTIKAVVSTGAKAASVVSQLTSTSIPAVGHHERWLIASNREVSLYRMPSTSRAYPLAVDKKAAYYRNMFVELGILH